jgi:hypothetical protein
MQGLFRKFLRSAGDQPLKGLPASAVKGVATDASITQFLLCVLIVFVIKHSVFV